MALSFAPATPGAAAPPQPAFGLGSTSAFGASTPAPATTSVFGSTPAAPSTGGFGAFGAAPATGAFGATPASSTGAFGAFGAPAPTSAFGGTPAFGSPAPAAGSIFGAAPAPYGQPQATQQQAAPTMVGPSTLYQDMPPQYQQYLDGIANSMMEHGRLMGQVQAMGPAALQGTPPVLQQDLQALRTSLQEGILPQIQALHRDVEALRDANQHLLRATILYGQWPTEAMAARRGIRLAAVAEEKKDDTSAAAAAVHQFLLGQMAHVDRLERLPSPFYWEGLATMESRLAELQGLHETIRMRSLQEDWTDQPITYVMQQHADLLFGISQNVQHVQWQVEELRQQYRLWETKVPNVLEQAAREDNQEKRRVNEEFLRMSLYKAAEAGTVTPATTSTPLFGGTPAAAPSTGFGSPAPAGGIPAFGAPPAAPAFGGTPAPGAFGAAPTPAAPAFGAVPTPAAPVFGAVPTPAAPAFGGTPAAAVPAFGGTPAAGASAFGATPAPGAALFGAAPAAATWGTTPSTSTPRKKSGSNSRRNKR